MRYLLVFLGIVAVALLGLKSWHFTDDQKAMRAWEKLAQSLDPGEKVYNPKLVQDLPEPARRYFNYVILPGARLSVVTVIEMSGELALQTGDTPVYQLMQAGQILVPPRGLVWCVKAGDGIMQISGSDGWNNGRSWTRFWIADLFPVVRVGNDEDHARSAFGRVIAESVFWAPAALLPREGVEWAKVDDDTARATVTFNDMSQSVDVTVNSDGQPVKVVIPRWSNANPDSIYRIQPFGGYLSSFREFYGYRLPTRVEGGNFIGADEYFPFYKAVVEDIQIYPDTDHGNFSVMQDYCT